MQSRKGEVSQSAGVLGGASDGHEKEQAEMAAYAKEMAAYAKRAGGGSGMY